MELKLWNDLKNFTPKVQYSFQRHSASCEKIEAGKGLVSSTSYVRNFTLVSLD